MTPAAAINSSGSGASLFDVFVNCPLCESPDCELLFVHKECGNVVRCAKCHLRYTRSRWTGPWSDIRRQNPGPLPDMIVQKQDSQIDDFLAIINTIKRYQPGGKLLELGCLTGHFLALARKVGYEVIGVEPDQWSAAYARREFGVTVREALAPNLNFDDQTFDVIAMFHVMEHFMQPMESLLALRRILKDTGLLAIEIPIVDTLFPTIMGRRHRHYVFDHTLFLSRNKAAEFLHKAGFKILHTELTGRRIRLERIAWVLNERNALSGRFLERAIKALQIQNWTVHINVRDNYRIYCRKT